MNLFSYICTTKQISIERYMNTIGKNYKNAINGNFKFTLIERSCKGIADTFNKNIKGSDNMSILPKVEEVELKCIDDTHDNVTLLWADYKIDGVITWLPSKNERQGAMVFDKID